MRKIKLGTRKSLLAIKQSEMVKEKIEGCFNDIEVEFVYMTTKGDSIQNRPLLEIGGKGLFITEFENALKNGDIDIAVHSGKDLPNKLEDGFKICTILKRGNIRDCIVVKKRTDIFKLENPVIGTGSLRRKEMAQRLFKDSTVKNLRGNVNTRIEKLKNGEFDAIILAKTGLERLNINDDDIEITELDENSFVPAASQAIIAVEVLENSEIYEILKHIENSNVRYEFDTERQLMSILDADCHEAAGAYINKNNDEAEIICFYKKSEIIKRRFNIKDTENVLNEIKREVTK